MTTENTTTESPPTAPMAAPAPQPVAPPIAPDVQALIDAAKLSAYNAGAKDTRIALEAKFKGQSPAPPHAAPAPRGEPSTVEALTLIKLRDDFDDATAELGLPIAQKKFLREQVMAQRPPDVDAFVRSFVDVWGRPAAPAAQPATSTPAMSPATHAPPVVSRPAAPAPPPVTDDAPILSMTPEQRESLARRIGNDAYARRLLGELPQTRIA